VTSTQLTKSAYLKLSRLKFTILIIATCIGAVLFLYAKISPRIYTSSATVFPLNASSESSNAASALTNMLGLSETPKSFVQEASINIVELALSRNTREAVALQRLPKFNNKRIAELLIEQYNKNKSFLAPAIIMSTDSQKLATDAALLIQNNINAKMNKNGILEINFSNSDEKLVGPINYKFVEIVSEFYKELKIRKAKLDFDFISTKLDSFQLAMNNFDNKSIGVSNRTMFVDPDKLQYQLPKDNLSNDKNRVQRQRDAAIDNREEALWRLQKETPIIAMLDKPEAPFDSQKPSAVLYALIGFFVGGLLISFLFIFNLLYAYVKFEIKNAAFGNAE